VIPRSTANAASRSIAATPIVLDWIHSAP